MENGGMDKGIYKLFFSPELTIILYSEFGRLLLFFSMLILA